jgi:D-3-phosphoglycerate dehydrogenase / 2-oxoglutarate reductase
MYDSHVAVDTVRGAGCESVADHKNRLAKADLVTIHVPANDKTCGMVTAAFLSCMKSSFMLANTA